MKPFAPKGRCGGGGREAEGTPATEAWEHLFAAVTELSVYGY